MFYGIKFNRYLNQTRFNRFFWHNLIGDSSEFSLESRIFHCVSISIFILCSFYTPYNIITKHYIPALFWILVIVAFGHEYYLSRIKRSFFNSIILGISGLSVIIVNYYSNSGIAGPTDIIFAASLLLIIAITPRRQHIIRLSINITAFILIHLSEYYYPTLVYHDKQSHYAFLIDQLAAYVMVVLLVYFIIKYVRKNYDKEKQESINKTKAIEQQYKNIISQNQQLDYANTEKSKLMSVISHDLKAPLISIQSYLQTAKGLKHDQEERGAVEQNLLKVTHETQDMLSKLLIWSKSQMEVASVKISNVNLLSALIPALEIKKAMALKKNIKFNYELPDFVNIYANADMLQIVVRNLVSNAIKFTTAGGNISIYTELTADDCKIIVKDNGCGIDYNKQADVFFLKAGSTYGTDNEKGIGLGLLLCHDFTKKQGGRIGFESVPGNGSIFFIFMPLASA